MMRRSCEVLSTRQAGAYWSLTLVAPDIAEEARPGQFVEIAVPGGRDFLLRRPFSIHQASRRGGWAGTVEVVFDAVGPGTRWLAEVKPHDVLDVIGPLGRGFQLPRGAVPSLLVGGGYGAAPLYFLAEELLRRGKPVNMIIGARDHERVFKPVEGKRLSTLIVVTTEDGSMGERGRVTDFLGPLVERTRSRVVYACGPNPMLRAVAEACRVAAAVPGGRRGADGLRARRVLDAARSRCSPRTGRGGGTCAPASRARCSTGRASGGTGGSARTRRPANGESEAARETRGREVGMSESAERTAAVAGRRPRRGPAARRRCWPRRGASTPAAR